MWLEIAISICVAALIAALLLVIEHYAPWVRYLTGNDRLTAVGNYILGTLALYLPWTGLALYWSLRAQPLTSSNAVLALWLITATGGLTVWACYKADRHHELNLRLRETEERERHLRERMISHEGPTE